MTRHKKISYYKSVIRILGFAFLLWNNTIWFAVLLLIFAEGLGIAEEGEE